MLLADQKGWVTNAREGLSHEHVINACRTCTPEPAPGEGYRVREPAEHTSQQEQGQDGRKGLDHPQVFSLKTLISEKMTPSPMQYKYSKVRYWLPYNVAKGGITYNGAH